MNQGDCRICDKPLLDDPGPVVMDRQGRNYHFLCWCKLMDVKIQEQREEIARGRRRLRENDL